MTVCRQWTGVKRNLLYRNTGKGSFEDITSESVAGDRGYGMGVAVGDVNNDGWEDLLVANGFITADDDRDL